MQEALRYMGYHSEVPSEDFEERAAYAIREIGNMMQPRVCYIEVPVHRLSDSQVDLEVVTLESRGLTKLIGHCERAYIFAATVGVEVDREIARRSRLSPVDHLIYDAAGSAAIEGVCNHFCDVLRDREEAAAPGRYYLKSRFSPGYGDLPIEAQRDLIRVLDTHRQIGLSLTEGMMMTPVKSVTAIVGVRVNEDGHIDRGLHNCKLCEKTDCQFREIFTGK